MPYAKKEDQAAAAARHYQKNRAKIKQRTSLFKKKQRKILASMVRAAKSVQCKDCGVQYEHYVMEFDHLGSSKLDNISDMVSASVSINKLLAEIEKCEVVCANCHRRRTWSRK